MAYYAAVISLKQTIQRLLNSSQISILPFDREIIRFIDEKVCCLQRVLDELDSRRNNTRSKRVESLRGQIREAAYKLQDALEFHVSDQFLSRSEIESSGDGDSNSLTFSLDVLDKVLKQKINNFADMAEKMENDCSKLSKCSLSEQEEEEEEDDVDSSGIGSVGTETGMVGLSDEFSRVKKSLLEFKYNYGGTRTFSICGMAGIGKTTLAKKIYYDPEVCNHFDCCLWVTIGQNYQIRKVLLCLLAQLGYDVDKIQIDGNVKLQNYLCNSLTNRRYLIVLDDVWDGKDIRGLTHYMPFDNKSQILVTTRLQQVAEYFAIYRCQTLRFLNKEESWCLLREKVLGERSCPYQLEKVGKKIAKNCDGLPLLVVTVADLLSKAEKTPEYWNKIAEGKDKSIFTEANDKISNILLRSYKYLPQDLKACLLYMGVFPPKCEIPTSKLYDLWIAEDLSMLKKYAKDCLDHFVSSNLVIKCQDTAIGGIKTCSLHSSFWHACVKQSWKEKFLHVIISFADISKEGVKSWRRLCTYNNTLFGIKEVYNSVESISRARSVICTGPNHQYPIPICFGLRLLKVPSSISKLWNLEYLIVRRHLSIKFHGDWSYLPVDVWNLQKLRHLQVIGSCLPYLCDALFPELLKLSGVSAHSCTKEIFERIPNLEKLGIQIELAPNFDAAEPFSCFDHLSHLHRLESLKCAIVNPNPARPQLVTPPISITTLPFHLKKLSLSGFGYPWNYMRVIGKLPQLRVLKLRSYAFRGPEWEVFRNEFRELRYLLLEDLDLVTFQHFYGFPNLDKLIIKHCYKFRTMPLRYASDLFRIEVFDSPLIAKYLQKHGASKVHIHSSWDDGEGKA